MCWSSDMVKVIFVHFSDTVFFSISKTLTDQHYDISMSQIHHPCIQIEPSRDQGYLNMTISLPLSESEVLMMEVECAGESLRLWMEQQTTWIHL